MAYNHGREERKWRLWKGAEDKILRKYGMDEEIIEEIRTYGRAEFNSNRRFYRRLNDVGEYPDRVAAAESQTEIHSVDNLFDEIKNARLYQALLIVDKLTLHIVLLKTQGYSTKEIATIVGLATGAIYRRLDRLKEKIKKVL